MRPLGPLPISPWAPDLPARSLSLRRPLIGPTEARAFAKLRLEQDNEVLSSLRQGLNQVGTAGQLLGQIGSSEPKFMAA